MDVHGRAEARAAQDRIVEGCMPLDGRGEGACALAIGVYPDREPSHRRQFLHVFCSSGREDSERRAE